MNSTSTMATQNVGSDCPSTAMTCAVRSSPVPFFTAAITPSGNAMASETPMAKAARLSELGRRSRRSSPTGRRARSDMPKSPRTALPTNDRYCSTYGRSRPRYRRASAYSSCVADMGRIRWSGSPVVLARAKTTTDRMARATSDCSSRERTNRITRKSALLARLQLVQVEVVHDRARVPLAELLAGRVGGMQVDERHARVLAPDPRVDVPHQRADLLLVRLAHDLGDHAVDFGIVHRVVGLGRRVRLLLEERVRADPVAVGDVEVADRARGLPVDPVLAERRIVDGHELHLDADLLPVARHRLRHGLALRQAGELVRIDFEREAPAHAGIGQELLRAR